jgi:hypothetical protein
MGKYRPFVLSMFFISVWCRGSWAAAAGRVQVELVTEPRAPITAQQEWGRAFAKAGLTGIRIRSGGASDRVGVEVRGSKAAPIYVVTGIITSSSQLVTPAGRFRPSEVGRFARWLEDLAERGPADGRPQQAAFGLSGTEFDEVRSELSRPVGFSTDAMSRAEVIRRIAAQLSMPLRLEADLGRTLEGEQVSTDLADLTCGTALAYAIRAPGLALVPRRIGRSGLELFITRAKPKIEAWPVGWESEKPAREVLPAIYEFLNVNVQGVTAMTVLSAVRERLKVPVLLDHNAMARHGVEPDTAVVNLPKTRTTYSLLLRKVLFQARLKSELRVDEAGDPFLWVTTVKPL